MGGEGSEAGSGNGETGDVVIAETEGSGECPGYMFRNVFCDQVRLTWQSSMNNTFSEKFYS